MIADPAFGYSLPVFPRLIPALVTFFGTAWALPPPAALAPKDGIAARFEETDRTYAVGDLHGDVHALYRIFRGLKLVDTSFRWTGGNSTAVLIGDLNDGGTTSRQLIDAAVRLHGEALPRGGKVLRLLGNHEMLAARGDANYAETEDILPFASALPFLPELSGSPRKRALTIFNAAFSDPRSRYARELAARNTFVAIGPRLFVHAGIHDLWPKEAWEADLETLNATVRCEIRRLQRRERFSDEHAEHWIVEADSYGPLWTRDTAYERIPASAILEFLRRHDADTLVLGHTSLKKGVPEPRYGKKVWLTDTKISSAYGGTLSALEFRRGVADPILHTQFPEGTAPAEPCTPELDSRLWP